MSELKALLEELLYASTDTDWDYKLSSGDSETLELIERVKQAIKE